MRILMLTLAAPLMSFGGVRVDQHGVIDPCPGLSLITGLLGNALGWRHADHARLQALQERLLLASRCDRPGEHLLDFHTVDLGDRGGPHEHPHGPAYAAASAKALMAVSKHGSGLGDGWTTRGAPESRDGGPDARYGTSIRYQHYHADRVQTCAIALADAPGPTLADLAAALERPARPLFIGRKTCLPSEPLLAGTCEQPRLVDALATWPRHRCAVPTGPLEAWWPDTEGAGPGVSHELPVTDARNWRTQLMVGRRLLRHGPVDPPPPAREDAA